MSKFFEIRIERGENQTFRGCFLFFFFSDLKAHCRVFLTEKDSLDVDNNFSMLRPPVHILTLFISAGSCFLFYARHSLISFLFQPIITTYKVLAENSVLRLVSVINYIYERAAWPSVYNEAASSSSALTGASWFVLGGPEVKSLVTLVSTKLVRGEPAVVCYTAVLSVVTQRSSPLVGRSEEEE